jgi:origin recognition complex subunit 5
MASERLAAATAAWPGREAQLSSLTALLGRPRDAAACIAVSGPPGSGKTGCVRAALAAAGHRAAYASCLECHAPRLLFETLLAQLAPARGAASAAWHPARGWAGARRAKSAPGAPPKPPGAGRCASLADFIEALRSACPRDGRAVYLVVDEAQRLAERRWGVGGSLAPGAAAAPGGSGAGSSRAAAGAHELLCALLRLDELTGRNIGVVFVSCAPWHAFRDATGARDPLPLLFPPYDGEALKRALCAAPPPRAAPGAEAAGADAALWRVFVASMMGVFGQSCRSLHELRALLAPLWRRYTKPIPELRAAGRTVEPRALYGMLTQARPAAAAPGAPAAAALHASLAVPLSAPALALSAEDGTWPIPASAALGAGRLDFDLPALSKFILLAAFIAARTPAGADAAAFADGTRPRVASGGGGGGGGGLLDEAAGADGDGEPRGAKRKRGGGASGGGGAAALAARRAVAAAEAALRGPGVFSLERLLAIFQSVLSRTEEETAEPMPPPAQPARTPGTAAAAARAALDAEDEDDDDDVARARGGTPRRLADGFGSPPGASPRGRASRAAAAADRDRDTTRPQPRAPPGGAVLDGPLLSDVFAQIASLCDLGLLSRASADPIELPRYRCAVTEPLARRLAANAAVPIDQYLNLRPC